MSCLRCHRLLCKCPPAMGPAELPTPRQLPNRLDTVRAFIRNQAGLTDTKPPRPGPGRAELNHAEAMQVADWLDELAVCRERQAQEREWRGYKREPAPEDREGR